MPPTSPGLPSIGLGTGPLRGDVGVALMTEAIRMGYRLLDTAAHYNNEREVGAAVRASGVPRDEIVVLTKIWPDKIGAADLEREAEASLERLGLDRIDLLLPHWPNPNVPLAETVEALNRLRSRGVARDIGLSNFTIPMMTAVERLSTAPIVANEVEYHPYLKQDAVIAACEASGVAVITHCPLDRAGAIFAEPPIVEAAQRVSKTPAQVVLRWHVQQGVIPIPSSRSASRLRQNISVFDFVLTDAEMAAISGLAAPGHRICAPPIPYAWDP